LKLRSQICQSDATINLGADIKDIGSPTSMAQAHYGEGQANSIVIIPRDGGPLSHLLNEDTTVNLDSDSIVTSGVEDQKVEDVAVQKQGAMPDIVFADYPESDVYTDANADYDEGFDGIKGERRFNYHYTNTMNPYPNIPISNPYPNNFNQQVSRRVVEETKKEESSSTSKNMLEMDWDENHEARFVKWVLDQKTARREEERKLQEQWQYLIQEKNNVEEQKRNIEAREAKISEVRDLIPSAQQLKEMGAQFSQVQAFISCVREKAAAAMIEERTAAWLLVKDLELYNIAGGLQKAVAEKTHQLSLLDTTLEQQKQAIATLVHLQKTGMTEEEISKLCMLVGRWNSNGVGLCIGQDNGSKTNSNSVNLELDSHLNLPNQQHGKKVN
jgi:hypothetical protein